MADVLITTQGLGPDHGVDPPLPGAFYHHFGWFISRDDLLRAPIDARAWMLYPHLLEEVPVETRELIKTATTEWLAERERDREHRWNETAKRFRVDMAVLLYLPRNGAAAEATFHRWIHVLNCFFFQEPSVMGGTLQQLERPGRRGLLVQTPTRYRGLLRFPVAASPIDGLDYERHDLADDANAKSTADPAIASQAGEIPAAARRLIRAVCAEIEHQNGYRAWNRGGLLATADLPSIMRGQIERIDITLMGDSDSQRRIGELEERIRRLESQLDQAE